MKTILAMLIFAFLVSPCLAQANRCDDRIGEYRQKFSNDANELEALDQLLTICHENASLFGPIQNALTGADPVWALKMINQEIDAQQVVEANKKALAPQ